MTSRENREARTKDAVVVCPTCKSAVEDLGFCIECGEVWVNTVKT